MKIAARSQSFGLCGGRYRSRLEACPEASPGVNELRMKFRKQTRLYSIHERLLRPTVCEPEPDTGPRVGSRRALAPADAEPGGTVGKRIGSRCGGFRIRRSEEDQ